MKKQVVFFGLAIKRLFVEGYTYTAAALAYMTLLSLVPFLSVVFFLITFFPFFSKLITLTQQYLVANFIPEGNTVIEGYLNRSIQQAVHLSGVSIIFLVLTAVLLICTIDRVLNDIWCTEKHKRRLISFVLRWLLLALTPLIIGLSLLLSSYLFSAHWLLMLTKQLAIKMPQLFIISLLVNTLFFSIFYITVPKYKVSLRDGFFGGVVAALLFELAKAGFGVYVRQFAAYTVIYGAIAIVPIFLVWLYIYWLIVLYGALVVYERYKWRERLSATKLL